MVVTGNISEYDFANKKTDYIKIFNFTSIPFILYGNTFIIENEISISIILMQ